jgi:hydrogenase small subunit
MAPKASPEQVAAIWLQAAGCSGCSVSLLNAANPGIGSVLLEQIVPGKHISLLFHPTVQAGSGALVVDILADAEKNREGYVLIVEGAIQEKIRCAGGVDRDGEEKDLAELVVSLAKKAAAVMAVGNCATYGGIPAAPPNPSGCKSVEAVLAEAGVGTPVVNVPGCPPHPDWMIGTLGLILLKGLPGARDLDDFGRPKAFFGSMVHENCPRRPYFDAGKFARSHGEIGCLYELGCKGPVTYADCPIRQWNNGVNWCIKAGGPCLGCVEPGFPDIGPGFYSKITLEVVPHIKRDEATGRLVFMAPAVGE